jgi:hypothetical protein
MIDNVYHMFAGNAARNSQLHERPGTQFAPEVKALLDHIAIELAAEYVRLMEAAARSDDPSPVPSD